MKQTGGQRDTIKHRHIALHITLAISLSTLFALHHLGAILSGLTPGSLDLPAISFLSEQLASFLRSGKLSGYVLHWNAGYAPFSAYPPLSYLLCALPQILSGGGVSADQAVNIITFITAALTPFAIFVLALSNFGAATAWATLLFAFFYCSLPFSLATIGVGYYGLFTVGYLASALACLFLICLLAALRSQRPSTLLLTLSTSAVILTHPIHAVFAAWILIFSFLERRELRKQIILVCLFSVLLTGLWLADFLFSLQFSSAPSFSNYREPFFSIFPVILKPDEWTQFTSLNSYLPTTLKALIPVRVENFLLNVPWIAFVYALCLIRGLVELYRQNKTLLLFIALSYLLLCGTWINEVFALGLYTHRFQQPLLMILITVAGLGLVKFGEGLLKRSRLLFATVFALIVSSASWYTLADFRLAYRADGSIRSGWVPPSLNANQFAETKHLAEVLSFFAKEDVTGRIAVESHLAAARAYGSPHILSAQLTRMFGHEVLGGFLTEASPTSKFFNPVMMTFSDQLEVGDKTLVDIKTFGEQSVEEALTRLSHFAVSHIVGSSREFRSNMKETLTSGRASRVFTAGSFEVYAIKNEPFISPVLQKPWFFEEHGGANFSELSKVWYLDTDRLHLPFVDLPGHSFGDLQFFEQDALFGVIASTPQKGLVPIGLLRRLCSYSTKNVVVLGGSRPPIQRLPCEHLRFISNYGDLESLHARLPNLLETPRSGSSSDNISILKRSADTLSIRSNTPVVARRSFTLGWRRPEGNAHVLRASPGFIFAIPYQGSLNMNFD